MPWRPHSSTPVSAGQDLRSSRMLLGGSDLLGYLVLALGGALLVGNVLALVRPPEQAKEGDLDKAPVARSVTMAAIGGIAALWAIASLLS